MLSNSKVSRPLGIYLILVWMAVNAFLMVIEVTVANDAADLNNSIELVLWIVSIAGLVMMKKWGAALTTLTLSYTIGISTQNVLTAYYLHNFNDTYPYVNAFRVIMNLIAVVYMFRTIFANKYR
jgi:hypothetical protein